MKGRLSTGLDVSSWMLVNANLNGGGFSDTSNMSDVMDAEWFPQFPISERTILENFSNNCIKEFRYKVYLVSNKPLTTLHRHHIALEHPPRIALGLMTSRTPLKRHAHGVGRTDEGRPVCDGADACRHRSYGISHRMTEGFDYAKMMMTRL